MPKQGRKHPQLKQSQIVTTIHKDVTERLELISKSTADAVRKILEVNKLERHIRGGMATKAKYKNKVERFVLQEIESQLPAK